MLRSPTVGQQSPHSRPTVDGKTSHKTANDSLPTVGQQSADSFWGAVLHSTLASAVKRMHVLVASYEFLVHVIFFWRPLSV